MTIRTLVAVLVVASYPTIATSKGGAVSTLEEQKELVLFQCLKTNYKSIGVSIGEHDWSQFSPRYDASRTLTQHFEWQSRLSDFVGAHVQEYYKDELSLKAEGGKPPFTHIFSKCVAFSKSTELHQFLKTNLPKP
ncbi:hypothetical protein [Piscinibacter sp. HJYY11]|uniref:hypothetical protein n=1 Tax=Piscinibacter sp. HJYY11 TaxID=2801333 RepID=UPI00191CFAE3|nr:hypothetical protein [Piscinibacter sp. HJYY11]MBL0729606.1 hypothetical protein [Piscinibacter sp. HJYY11]